MLNKRRKIAFIAAVLIVFSIFFSTLYIVHMAEHKCTGEDCYICANIDSCLKHLGNTTPNPESSVYTSALVFLVILIIGYEQLSESYDTLISLKVKLSN